MVDSEERFDASPIRTPVLITKLKIPHAVARTVKRQRLIERISQGARGKAMFLCAPAGFGKSTLLQIWAEQARTKPAWYSLDPGDNDPQRFWRYVVSAVDRIHSGFEERIQAAARKTANRVSLPSLLPEELRRLDGDIVLVLDDFHTIENESLLASFALFIEQLPGNAHLLVAGRGEPVFPKGGPESFASACRLGPEELRFDMREGHVFLTECMDLELSEAESGEWVLRSEGWITGMKLAALSMRGREPSPRQLRGSSGASQLLDHYLLEEVLMPQNEPIRRFLLACSVLKRMNASLCQAVAGEERSGELLERLQHAQLFLVPLDGRGEWFRFHRLFAEFLYYRLSRTDSDAVPRLLEKAGSWCEREELLEEALDYYLNGKHYGHAFRLLEERAEAMNGVSAEWLGKQLARIPESELIKHPILYFSYVHSVLVNEGNDARGQQLLDYAERRFTANEPNWSEDEKDEFRGSYHFLKMLQAAMLQRDPELAAVHMKKYRQYRPFGIRLIFAQPKYAGLPSIVREHIGGNTGFRDQDQLVAFVKSFAEPEAGEEAMGASPIAFLAELYYEFNELDEARRYAEQVAEPVARHQPDRAAALFPSRLVLFRIWRTLGDRLRAVETMKRMRRDILEPGMPDTLIYCDAELALLAAEEGDEGPARAWLERYALRAGDGIADRRLYEYQYLARIYAALGHWHEALDLSEKLLEIAARTDRFLCAAELAAMRLTLLHRLGQSDEALSGLCPLLFELEQTGYERILLDAGEPMADLLTLLVQLWEELPQEGRPSFGYVRSLFAGFGRRLPPESLAESPGAKLTRKELEVLRLIVKRRTNKEIAAELGISRETVKSHINNIYSVLWISSRAEAIRKGERLLLQT